MDGNSSSSGDHLLHHFSYLFVMSRVVISLLTLFVVFFSSSFFVISFPFLSSSFNVDYI